MVSYYVIFWWLPIYLLNPLFWKKNLYEEKEQWKKKEKKWFWIDYISLHNNTLFLSFFKHNFMFCHWEEYWVCTVCIITWLKKKVEWGEKPLGGNMLRCWCVVSFQIIEVIGLSQHVEKYVRIRSDEWSWWDKSEETWWYEYE